MLNDLYNKMKAAFFQGEPEKGMEYVKELLSTLDYDDDDDMELAEKVIGDAVFRSECAEALALLEDSKFPFDVVWAGKGGLAIRCIENRCYNPEIFDRLVELGADPYLQDNKGNTILNLIASQEKQSSTSKQSDFFAHLLQIYDMNRLFETGPYGGNPLHFAVLNGQRELIKTLLDKGADCNATGSAPNGGMSHVISFDGVTPLQLACQLGDYDSVNLLLAHEANAAQKDGSGRNSAFYALLPPNQHFCPTWYQTIPAKDAVCERKKSILGVLPQLDESDDMGLTPLIACLSQKDYDIAGLASVLIECKVNCNAASHTGYTALMAAAENGFHDAAKLLVGAGAEINHQNQDGDTALHFAVETYHTKTARYLIKKGADFKIVNNKGNSPADMAGEKGMTDVLELML